jgi:diacylglycerol kinase (ATP)
VRATLIHNRRAGTAQSENELVSALDALGWKVHRSVSKGDFDPSTSRGSDVIVVAGGDGTVAAVARQLAGTEVPMAIIPMGTANNIARSLGLGVDAAVALCGLDDVVERRVDLGVVRGPVPLDDMFIEAVSVGLFADVMANASRMGVKRLPEALGFIANHLDVYAPRRLELTIEGRDYSGYFVLVAVMNARSLGPALNLAPQARCDDGILDVVLVRPDVKPALVAHLRRAAEGGDIELPAFETVRASRVSMKTDGGRVHVDDRSSELRGNVDVDVSAAALRLLVPAQS